MHKTWERANIMILCTSYVRGVEHNQYASKINIHAQRSLFNELHMPWDNPRFTGTYPVLSWTVLYVARLGIGVGLRLVITMYVTAAWR